MPDDKTKMDERDRSKVAAGEDYEVAHLAKRFKITAEEARKLIEQHGTNRATLEKLAEALKR
jgi:Protein of unknown function (DUF3606)